MTREELEAIGRKWLRVVALVRQEGIAAEQEHVRFRDGDLSVKGAALLGFAGLMLASDLVFLTAAKDSLIAPHESCGTVGLASFVLLVVGAFCALVSIMITRKGKYTTAWESFGLMKLYHDRRRRWLMASSIVTCLGTLTLLVALGASMRMGKCLLP